MTEISPAYIMNNREPSRNLGNIAYVQTIKKQIVKKHLHMQKKIQNNIDVTDVVSTQSYCKA